MDLAAMDLVVHPAGAPLSPWLGTATWAGERLRCALGRSGVTRQKREGDGATPVGAFFMRRLLYRADLCPAPPTGLQTAPIGLDDGWCDDPRDPAYNRPVTFPCGASAERLWRDDRIYDLIVPLGYNDEPVVPGAGSAIFLHLARPGYEPTLGCVALAAADLMRVLAAAGPTSRVVVRERPAS
jgi:L,D-peptidoglycan transpeptidase YkuD (ErfK/YbiS/YcfS/YnhG family)